jgi:hypothetical protein
MVRRGRCSELRRKARVKKRLGDHASADCESEWLRRLRLRKHSLHNGYKALAVIFKRLLRNAVVPSTFVLNITPC